MYLSHKEAVSHQAKARRQYYRDQLQDDEDDLRLLLARQKKGQFDNLDDAHQIVTQIHIKKKIIDTKKLLIN